ncbi:hypothetical protein LTR08_003578 [Meristemomyces frigidus]|nr:hypothetical protein LTR08_003578 [Meristemomyces frigidus]
MQPPTAPSITLFLLTLATLTLFPPPASASHKNTTLPPLPKSAHASLLKRWYGVKPLHAHSAVVGGWGPWPIMCPTLPSQTQPIRYCFKDARSATTLQPIVDQAVAKWAHALHPASSLQIGLDHAGAKVCSGPAVRADALVISDESRPEDPQWKWEECDSQSTVGYNYGSDERARHTLAFCHLKPGDESATEAKAVQVMMHELGHVMGLQHEHQRPDRDETLTYVCKNLEAYEQGVKDAEYDVHALYDDDLALKDRITLICLDAQSATVYLPDALAFIRGDNMQVDRDDERWPDYAAGGPLDVDSIMIYDSNLAAKNPDAGVSGWVMYQTNGKKPVWMGGSQDASKTSISSGDVERVKQLYPLRAAGGNDKRDQADWGQQALRVRIRDSFEMIVEPPRTMEREL